MHNFQADFKLGVFLATIVGIEWVDLWDPTAVTVLAALLVAIL